MTFIDDLLAEAEVRDAKERIEMSRLRADQALAALAALEHQAEEVDALAQAETDIIDTWQRQEREKIERKASWLEYQLEQYIRSTGDKTITLPHGTIRVRLGRDRAEITDPHAFLRVARERGLLRSIPASEEPDMARVVAYLKSNRALPGAVLVPAVTRFSYTTKGAHDDTEEQSQA